MPITIKDVASHSGVSPSTVSKVIHNDPSITPETRRKVKNSIETLRYKPNMQARNFVQQRTNHIIFLAKKEKYQAFTNPHMFEIMSGVEECLSEKEYYLSIKFLADIEEAPSFIQESIHQKMADGIIIYGSVITKKLAALLIEESLPYIIIGKPAFQTKANWIDTDNFLSGQLCGEHLLNKGYRKIAFLCGSRSDNIFKQRLYGFYKAMRTADVEISTSYIKYEASTKENALHLTRELLSLEVPPEVIICTNNFVALGVQKAIEDSNLKVPQDINYICFDKYPLAYIMDPRPIIVDIDVNDLGVQAAMLLLQRIKSPALQIQTYSIYPNIFDN